MQDLRRHDAHHHCRSCRRHRHVRVGGVAHTVLGLGNVGMKPLQNEEQTVAAITQATGNVSGLYVFPYSEVAGQTGMRPGAGGFLVYSSSAAAMTPKTLGTEALLEIAQALIVAFLLSLTTLTGYMKRVAFVIIAGVAVTISTNLSYLIWYDFPADYTLAYMFTDFVRYLVAGLVIALILKPRPQAA